MPALFDEKLNIVPQNGHYIWGDQRLYKSVLRYRPNRNWMGEYPNYEIETTIFENVDQSIQVRIATGGYIQKNCQPYGQEQNTIIKYKIDEDKTLLAYANVDVYDNIIAFFICKNN